MKTEQEFAIALKKAMRYARKHKCPQYIARHMGLCPGVYFAYESGAIKLSAYQLYVFIHLTGMGPDFITSIYK